MESLIAYQEQEIERFLELSDKMIPLAESNTKDSVVAFSKGRISFQTLTETVRVCCMMSNITF